MKSPIVSYIAFFATVLVAFCTVSAEQVKTENRRYLSKPSSEWKTERNDAIREIAKKHPLTGETDQTSWTRSATTTNNVTIKVCVGQVKYKEYGPFLYRTMTFDATGKLISISEVNEVRTYRCDDVIKIP